jgi:hypothetical protein
MEIQIGNTRSLSLAISAPLNRKLVQIAEAKAYQAEMSKF